MREEARAGREVEAPDGADLLEDFESFDAGERWTQKSEHADWEVRYDGFGRVETAEDDDGGMVLRGAPKAAASDGETHAVLVTTKKEFRDFELEARIKTVRQLRASPNPWETAWLMWRYADDDHFYYFALKGQGWELGKGDPKHDGEQDFLDDSLKNPVDLGRWHDVKVRQVDNHMRVWVDGEPLVDHHEADRTHDEGHIGLYTEDAEVMFDDVRITSLS